MVLELARRVIVAVAVAVAVATTATVVVRREHQIKKHAPIGSIGERKWRRKRRRKRILGWLLGQRTDPQSLPTIVENGLRFYNGVTQYCRVYWQKRGSILCL